MNSGSKAMLATAGLIGALALVPSLHAGTAADPSDGGNAGHGMTGGRTMPEGMMGGGSSMGRMNMMGRMSGMMEQCNRMMEGMANGHGGPRPNEQWRNPDRRQEER